jgi:hypothetical protein
MSDSSSSATAYVCKACGATGQTCCSSGTACRDAGTACSGSTCVPCGGPGQPCCAGSKCADAGTICNSSGLCVVCGKPGTSASPSSGTPCCPGNRCDSGCCVTRYSTSSSYSPVCVAAASSCDYLDTSTTSTLPKPVCDVTTAATGACTNGTTSCGGVGQACCVSNYSTSSTSYYYCAAPGTRCLSSIADGGLSQYTCTPCGEKGQRCCYDTSSTSSTNYGWGTGCKSPYVCTYSSSTNPTYQCTDAPATATATSLSISPGL